MDQIKIGNYIANKRKELGMTQMQLAEKLGMSDKSVSKWERGVCLPDVSVYESLCNNLGISINEFLAGEDLKKDEVIRQSERNIISILRDSKMSRIWGRKIIATLAMMILLLLVVVLWLLNNEGYFNKNYVRLFDSDSEDYRILSELLTDNIDIFNYCVDKKIKRAEVKIYEYEGKKEELELISWTSIETDEYKEGSIAIIPDFTAGLFNVNMANYETKITDEIPINQEARRMGMATTRTDEVMNMKEGKEYPICAFCFADNDIDAIIPEEIYPNPKQHLPKEAYCIIATVSFYDEKHADIEVPNLIGLTMSEAEEMIKELGLTLGEITCLDADDNESNNIVIKQYPSAGTMVTEGKAIRIEVKLRK